MLVSKKVEKGSRVNDVALTLQPFQSRTTFVKDVTRQNGDSASRKSLSISEKFVTQIDEFRLQVQGRDLRAGDPVKKQLAYVLRETTSEVEEFLRIVGLETGEEEWVVGGEGNGQIEEAEGTNAWVGMY